VETSSQTVEATTNPSEGGAMKKTLPWALVLEAAPSLPLIWRKFVQGKPRSPVNVGSGRRLTSNLLRNKTLL